MSPFSPLRPETRNRLLASSALLGGVLLITGAAMQHAQATACAGAANNASSTICGATIEPGPLDYPTDNGGYVGGNDFTLTLNDTTVNNGVTSVDLTPWAGANATLNATGASLTNTKAHAVLGPVVI